MQNKILDLISKFNTNGDLGLLVFIFTSVDCDLTDLIETANKSIHAERLKNLRFFIVRFTSELIVFVDSKGKLALLNTEEDSLRLTLNEIKSFENSHPNIRIDSYNLRTAILIAGQGSIKSYDVYTNINTFSISKKEVKFLLFTDSIWIKNRTKLHSEIIEKNFKDVKALSEIICKSKNLGAGIYCVRGSVAAGKTVFVQNFLQRNTGTSRLIKGTINTDLVKQNLVRDSKNLIASNIPAYLFHDEASMVNRKILLKAREGDLSYFIDSRMQEEKDLQELLEDGKHRKLPVIIFDIQVDFITSTLRVLKRTGVYPSDPTPDFDGLYKSYIDIEEGRNKFFKTAMHSAVVKSYYSISSNDSKDPTCVLLKDNFDVSDQGHLYLLDFAENCFDKEFLANMLLPTGGVLKQVLDIHSRKSYMAENAKSIYYDKLLENIKNTSRSYNGELNLSASSDKADKMYAELTKEEVSFYVNRNLDEAFEYIYDNKNLVLTDTSVLKRFINQVALIVNKDLIAKDDFLIRKGRDSKKYNYVSTEFVEEFYDSFINQLYIKLTNANFSYIDTAAWVEWNIDFTGHIFSDGCGRVAKLISTWSIIRRNQDLPDYAIGQDGLQTIRESYRKRFSVRSKIEYKMPIEDDDYLAFLHYYRALFISNATSKIIKASGGLVYNSAGKFLILQSTKGKDRGKWVIPGGKIEKGETYVEAFVREVLEETGIYVEQITLLGNRDYVSPRGNHYYFFDYSSVALDENSIKINSESSDFRWITHEQLGNYQFTDSIRDFFNKYVDDNMLDYYKNVEKISLENLDLPNFGEHTMSSRLDDYVKSKLPFGALEKYLPYVDKFEVHGIYPDLGVISELNLGFTILKVIAENAPKKDNSNSIRPIFLLVEKEMKRFIVCCTTPGTDLLLHYSSMIGYLIKEYPNIKLSVSNYPIAEREIDKWTGLDGKVVYKDDIVILGYSTFLKEYFTQDLLFAIESSYKNKFYTSTRFINKSGVTVNCLEANYGHWGNISDYLSSKICELGAKEIIHVGKVGNFISPTEIYQRIYIPANFAIGRRKDLFYQIENISNSFGYITAHASAMHVSVSTTLEETLAQRDYFCDFKIETIDIESSKIAKAIASYNLRNNLRSNNKVRFGSIHFSTDYLRRQEDLNEEFKFDLSTKRAPEVKAKKIKILTQISEIIKNHIIFLEAKLADKQ